MAEQNQRQIAIKIRIADILQGKYIKEEGWNPNYILTQDGKKASRVNLLGVVVSVPTAEMSYRSINLDDGSGIIPIRSFDETDLFQGLTLGDVVFVIGRPREYGSEIYIMPEIVKKIENKLWIEVRKTELEKEGGQTVHQTTENLPKVEDLTQKETKVKEEKIEVDEIIEKKESANEQNAQQKIYSLIKEIDTGDGAEFEQILEKANNPDAEKIISQLLMEGEIFELSKGKLKVLE